MSAPLRFLVLAILAWGGIRAATLGIIPGAETFKSARAEPAPPPIVPTVLPPIEPVRAGADERAMGYYGPYGPSSAYPYPPPIYVPVPVYYRAAAAPAAQELIPSGRAPQSTVTAAYEPQFYSPIPSLEEWDVASLASTFPERQPSSPAGPQRQIIPQKHLDRLQLSAWAILRGRNGTGALASGGTLGGSQAGARLTYALNPRLAVSLRSSSPVGGTRGGEIAGGLRLTPLPSIPVALTAERRQAIGRYGGRSAFALFLEGGVYQRPLPWNFSLDAYAQGGIVGLNSRDLFADGGLTVMRPIYGPVSIGAGFWGGAQPGLYRVDAGPRLSVRVRRNMRVDLDWRQRLAGQAEPGSGPALTLAADF